MKDRATKADITAAVLLDEDTLLLFGATDESLPADSLVLLDGTTEGRFVGGCWTDGQGERWFLGAIRVGGLAQMRPSRIEIVDATAKRLVLPRLSNVRTNPAHLVAALKEEQPGALTAALDFACTLLPATGGRGGEGASDRRRRLLAGLVQEASAPDGFAEVLGRFHDGGLMVQGWSHGVAGGEQAMLVETDELRLHNAAAASFHRPDLPPEAAGLLAVLTGPVAPPDGIRRIHYRAADGWRHLAIFEHRKILADGVAPAHARDMLGNLRDDGARRAVTAATAARYNGVETVSQLDAPVRIGLDMALRVPGAGLFVCGWLLDPARLVRAVTLKGPGLAARLDGDWMRSARRDVSEAFAADPLIAGRLVPGSDSHGFTAFASEPAELPAGAEFHLELAFDDGVAFLPLPCQPPSSDALRRMLGAVNPDSPSIDRIVAAHLGPMLRAAGSGVPAPAAILHPMGRTVTAPRVSVILPVTDGREDIDLNLARLSNDPDFAATEILVAAGTATHERLAGMVRQAAAFYRLAVGFVAAPSATDPFEAVAAALPHARADRVLLLSPSVLPTEPGWLSALERAMRKPVAAGAGINAGLAPVMVSPTLLYEDHSIRFAGIVAVEGPDGAVTYERRFAGYPRDWLKEKDASPVDAAAADCALLPRDLLARALAAGGRYLGADHKGLDLCLRVRAAGGSCLWLPRVRLVALDEQPRDAHDPCWRRMSALVDQWSFAESWSAAIAA
ncbi:glycosyltransferase family 2 protein [Azospirillum agricola]|uniref:glycosyltransferase family 2 protein n=1 Tax=Azospirillum agricola TaxID=1720247 RepID=UPI000A0F3DCB|nr:hypothetical protein [Azospirillum agricola]SMH29452.1 Glycosyltransferase, GT2 family [Azospirillum lipoferum]